jgi:uncharacterized protein YecT (DUF1311 family)
VKPLEPGHHAIRVIANQIGVNSIGIENCLRHMRFAFTGEGPDYRIELWSIFFHLVSIAPDTDGQFVKSVSMTSQLHLANGRSMARGLPEMASMPSNSGETMKIFSRYSIAICIGLLTAIAGCGGSKQKSEPTASTPPDTMLLRDLAEANKNTATAAVQDNSLNTVRTAGMESTASGLPNTETPDTRTQVRPSSPPNTSPVTTASAPVSDAPTRKATIRRPAKVLSVSHGDSGDPCDSPAAVDQRTCLNRSIVVNDADLNRTYQEVIAQATKSGGSELESRIREAQREWINTRDAACRPDNGGTGLWARGVASCLADYSARRTAELRRTLSGLRGQ